jgi:hypothetical protein
LHWVLFPQINAQQNAALRYYIPQAQSPFWLLKPASEHAHARLLPRLSWMSWSWTVLLTSDTHRNRIASTTAALLPLVTYLLTLPRVNPLDFYLWGHLKALVCATPVVNEEALYHHNVDACQTICNNPGIFEWMLQSTMRRVEACIDSRGGHFAHLL